MIRLAVPRASRQVTHLAVMTKGQDFGLDIGGLPARCAEQGPDHAVSLHFKAILPKIAAKRRSRPIGQTNVARQVRIVLRRFSGTSRPRAIEAFFQSGGQVQKWMGHGISP